MTLTLVVPTTQREGFMDCPDTFADLSGQRHQPLLITDASAVGLLPKMQWAYENVNADVLGYIHDDVVMREQGWDVRVLREFDDPTVGVVGFGGALQHGSLDIYKTPYRLQQLGRSFYRSNTDDAELHGERFVGACNVAVLDSYAMFIRRELLDKVGGFPILEMPAFEAHDYWVCITAHKLGYRIRLVGVKCHHYGGMTSVNVNYERDFGETHDQMYERAHRFIYEYGRGTLPVMVTP